MFEYNPATALRKVTCPLLAINGEKDLRVGPKQYLPAIREVLPQEFTNVRVVLRVVEFRCVAQNVAILKGRT